MELPTNAIRIHMYHLENVLRPRGLKLQKESLSLEIFQRLKDYYESWTDPKYGDNPTRKKLISVLEKNLQEEVQFAVDEFCKYIGIEEKGKTNESTHCS